MTSPNSSTSDQILLALGELKAQVAVVDERLKVVPDHEQRIRALEGIAELAKDVTDHETRIRSLERWRWTLTGAGTLAGGVVGYLASQLGHG